MSNEKSQSEQQAQAGEPEVVAWRNGDHEYRKVDGVWQLHYLPVDDGVPLRYCDQFESAKLEAIAKKNTALQACVRAMRRTLPKEFEDEIAQAEEALK